MDASRPGPRRRRPAALALLLALLALACGRAGEGPDEAARPPSLLLVSVDTLRADRLGAYGAETAATPHLDAIGREGVRFETAVAPTPLTLPSHATLLTGLDPPRHGIRHNGLYRLGEEVPTLAGRLHEAGYATAAVVGSTMLAARYGLDRGFERYDDEVPAPEGRLPASAEQRRGEAVTAVARRWLRELEPPFFLWLHYYDPHAPYAPPEPWSRRFEERPYQGEIAYTDAQIGRVLEALRAAGLLEKTVVVATADHGESLGEHGERTHSYTVYDATQRVPLLFRGPGVPRGSVVEGVVRLADVAPTLLALAGAPALEGATGRDLAPLWRRGAAPAGRRAYVETLAGRLNHGWSPLHGLRTPEHLYVRAPKPELYHVPSDPGQRENLLAEGAPEARERRERLERALAERLAGAEGEAEAVALDDERRAQLHALGYALPSERPEASGLDPKEGLATLALLRRARRAGAEGRGAERVRLLREAVARMPESPRGHQQLAIALASQGELEAARRHAKRATELLPGSADHWIQLGVVERRRGAHAAALRAFRRAVRLAPRHPVAQAGRMEALAHTGRLEAAAEAEERVLALAPKQPALLRRLADAWEAAGATERALAAYRRVLEAAPGSERDHMHAAIHLARLGRLEASDRHLARSGAVRRDPRARRMLAAAYRASGHAERAAALAAEEAEAEAAAPPPSDGGAGRLRPDGAP